MSPCLYSGHVPTLWWQRWDIPEEEHCCVKSSGVMAPKWARTEKPVQMDPGEDGEELQGASGGVVEPDPSGSSSRDIAELKHMFQKFLVDQRERQVHQEQENARQETRLKSLQHQFRLLQGEVSQHTSLGSLPLGESEGPGTASNCWGSIERAKDAAAE